MGDAFGAAIAMVGLFGGTSLVIWTTVQAKIARIKAEAQVRQMTATSLPDSGLVAELKAMRQQMEQISSTSHQFDISFDEALNRMESRVNRLETKAAAATIPAAEPAQTLRNGQSPPQ